MIEVPFKGVCKNDGSDDYEVIRAFESVEELGKEAAYWFLAYSQLIAYNNCKNEEDKKMLRKMFWGQE